MFWIALSVLAGLSWWAMKSPTFCESTISDDGGHWFSDWSWGDGDSDWSDSSNSGGSE